MASQIAYFFQLNVLLADWAQTIADMMPRM